LASKRRASGDQLIWQAPENGNLDQILVGAKLFSNVTGDYYNWRLALYRFSSGLDFRASTGIRRRVGQQFPSPVSIFGTRPIVLVRSAMPARSSSSPDLDRLRLVLPRFIDSYMSPGAFPYPLAVGGSMIGMPV